MSWFDTTVDPRLEMIEDYYDAVPRRESRAEDVGPLTLFVRLDAGWPYYARPAIRAAVAPTAADVARVRDRQRELGVPQVFEWVHEVTPAMRGAAEATGLHVGVHPLMVLEVPDGGVPVPPLPEGMCVRVLGADDVATATALTVGHFAFGEPGTKVGRAGRAELLRLAGARQIDGSLRSAAARLTAGLSVLAAAVDKQCVALATGQHQPIGAVSEIVGVGTLPAERRRGLGLAVTSLLARDALERGVTTVFMSADSENVARIYARLGFRRIGTSMIAEP